MPSRHTPLPSALAPKDGSERRTVVRHPCSYAAPFRAGDQFGTALVRDLSAGGVGMLVPQQLAPGGLLTVELLDKGRQSWHLKLVHVVHATARAEDLWLIGTAFTRPLTDDELCAILP